MELITISLCDNNDDNISHENNTKIYVLIVMFLFCKRSKLTSCNIPYVGSQLAALLEIIIMDILLLDLAKSSSTLKAAFWVVGIPQMCVETWLTIWLRKSTAISFLLDFCSFFWGEGDIPEVLYMAGGGEALSWAGSDCHHHHHWYLLLLDFSCLQQKQHF